MQLLALKAISKTLEAILELLQMAIFSRLEEKLDALAARVEILIKQGESIMATQAEFDARLKTIDDNTTASAAAAQAIEKLIVELKAQIAGGGLTPAAEAAVLGKLDLIGNASGALKTFLEATAKGGAEPAPVPVPTPVP